MSATGRRGREVLRNKTDRTDAKGLLDIAPEQRDHYREIYERIADHLPAGAAAMAGAEVVRLREGRAELWLRRVETIAGEMGDTVYPVEMVRSARGRWQIYSY